MEQKDYRLAAIMYTDIAGFSRMMERDESGTLEMLKFHNDLIGEIVGRHHGTVIKTIGDALLVDFKNTVEALQSALEIQDKLYVHNKEHQELPLLVRIGLHLGDIYFFENDALGEGINIAARLQSLARPGCICFSQDVYNLVLNKIEFRAEKLGKVSLKNITKEIHAYEITTPNVEFDPNRDKPLSGYKPGTYLDDTAEVEIPVGGLASSQATATGPASPAWASSQSGRSRPAAPITPAQAVPPQAAAPQAREAPQAPAAPESPPRPYAEAELGAVGNALGKEPDREYSIEGSKAILAEIRKAILQDIKNEGRRLGVDEALDRYGDFGVEAHEVIASMADQGLLIKRRQSAATSRNSGSASSDLGKTIEAAVHGIVSEIEKSVERGIERSGSGKGPVFEARLNFSDRHELYGAHSERQSAHDKRRYERRALREELKRGVENLETGKWDKKLAEDEAWKPGTEELSSEFDGYRKGLVERARKARGGFIGNLVSYISVNGVLWFLNLTTSPGFPWAAIVSAAWGIGLASSAVAAARGSAKAREAESMPELNQEQFQNYKKLNRVKDSILQHGVTVITVPFLLGLINFITSSTFLWFLIPSAAIAVSFISHLIAYRVTKPRLERLLKESLGVKGAWKNVQKAGKTERENAVGLGPYAELFYEAERTKAAILAETAGNPVDDGLEPSLREYVGQVRLLAQSANEIDRIVEAIPMTELERDKAALASKEKNAGSSSLKAEYKRSIEEIERQEKSYDELKNQSEVIRLRLGSSVNQLKQMRIDVARVKAAGEGITADGMAGGGMSQLKRRTDELSRYLEDLRKGYDESRKDPFAELEAAEKAKAASLPDPGASRN